jgi:hypothetical protein
LGYIKPGSANPLQSMVLQHQEVTMARSIAVGLVILAVSTSAALAAHRTHHA